jgi:hypothetical protein
MGSRSLDDNENIFSINTYYELLIVNVLSPWIHATREVDIASAHAYAAISM